MSSLKLFCFISYNFLLNFFIPKNRGGDEKSNIEANNVNFEVDEITNTSPNNENISVEPCPISCADFSDALHVKETQQGPIEDSNLNLKGAEGYNKLLEQYYELEEKRQKVLDQLYHGGWNYDDVSAGSSVGTQWGTSSAYQEHPVPASQTSHNHAISTCWPSSYPIPVGMRPLFSICFLFEMLVGNTVTHYSLSGYLLQVLKVRPLLMVTLSKLQWMLQQELYPP